MEHRLTGSPGYPERQSDDLPRYVHVRRRVNERFVEFYFAIGDPTLYIELVLPKDAFDAFCQYNRVIMMTDEQVEQVEADMAKWRYGDLQ